MLVNTVLSSLPLAEGSTHAHTGEWVAAVLRSRIAEGQLLPGAKLSEQSLSAALGVSRNTLREAFAVLDNELIITRIPNRGVFVSSPGASGVKEIYGVRRIIEPAAVLWGPNLDTDALAAIVVDARAALAAGDIAQMADANQCFHEQLVRATGSERLQELMTRVLAQMRLVFHAMSDAPDFHSHYVELNASLVELLVAGQREEASIALRGYLDRAEAELLAHLGEDN
ncbi:GntR family transcriptional regulator [Paeniglutamicibacter kerguelensis]|uniref:DNA-binding GntR family transcriptional regulator n=1 Tax=Paeniglutamicibacter kerguelensis TaxID=254788 RepID=A0ABS4XGD0_9MICC|nr:GntR family transcriptional regulator [Paeniglutamicibacter kerguelensis]MBP2387522.1 DNA-binding GntR family transcriptional regulator [Paeniglutamicibacter kerguelensis]